MSRRETGVNRNGKGVERAWQEAERRREDEARLQSELEQLLFGTTSSSQASTVTASPSPADEVGDPFAHQSSSAFSMPVIAQPACNMFDFPFSTASTLRDDTIGSPVDSCPPHGYAPSSAGSSASSSSSHGSVPRTPDLSSGPGSSRSSIVESLSPTWSRDLFGAEDDEAPEGLNLNGENDEHHANDLFGDREEDEGGRPARAQAADGRPTQVRTALLLLHDPSAGL